MASWKAKDDMVLVPAGEFLMGSDKKTDRLAYRGEVPQRRVYLDAFEIGKYEITQAQFEFFGAENDTSTPMWSDHWDFPQRLPSHVRLTMNEIAGKGAGKRRRRKQNGRKQRAEWTGGSFLGIRICGAEQGEFWKNRTFRPGAGSSKRVLLYPPIISVDKYEKAVSPYGPKQTIGNVAEWVSDWYDPGYYTATGSEPQRPDWDPEGLPGVVAGWTATIVRVAMRNGTDPDTKINWMGFRCARDVQRRRPLKSRN
jgi:iron(II)-dependent oxidoreductase